MPLYFSSNGHQVHAIYTLPVSKQSKSVVIVSKQGNITQQIALKLPVESVYSLQPTLGLNNVHNILTSAIYDYGD